MTKNTEEDRGPTICPHGIRWAHCREQACVDYMDALEEAAYCDHGFLIGCPVCTKKEGV